MSNTIKFKRGSGSDPSASDLIVGEIAIRTDSGKLFTKKDNGSVAEISGGGGIDDGDKGDITVSNSGDTFTIDSGVITEAKIAGGAVTSSKIAADSVNTAKIADSAVTEAQLATDAVTTVKIDGGAVTSAKIAASSINTAKIVDSAVTSAKIADGTIVNADINSSAAIAGTKISPNFGSQAITGTTGTFTGGTLTLGTADSSSAHINSFELMTFNIDTDNDDTNRYFAFYKNGASGSGTELFKIEESGAVTVNGSIDITGASTVLKFTENDANPDFGFLGNAGSLRVQDITNSANLFIFEQNRVRSIKNFDAEAGLDVTGNITVTGLVDGIDIVAFHTQAQSYFNNNNSGVLTDGVTATTQSAGNNTTRVATTAFVTTAINNLINGAPSALDTLNELAAAMNDNASFSTTVTNSLATKMPLAGGEFTGNITFSGSQTVDGRDLSVDGSKLDGIESGATADQSNSEIKTAYEANSDTNAFTDALLSKLNGIAASATNVTNNNQLTNGAGYITATLTNEQVQDIVGGMVSGNTESGITVTYQDSDGTLDFTVGTLNQDTTGNAASATTVDISGISTNAEKQVVISNNNDGSGRTLAVDSSSSAFTYNPSTNVLTAGTFSGALSGNASTATKLATARTIAGVSFDGSANISLNNNAITNGAGYLTSVGTSNISDAAVTNAKIAAGAVGGTSLGSNAVSTAKIADSAVTNAKIDSMAASKLTGALPAIDGSNLTGISAGATGGGSDEVFYENDQTVTTNYTITNGKNAMAAGPITINSGVTVTVGSGETLTIV